MTVITTHPESRTPLFDWTRLAVIGVNFALWAGIILAVKALL